MARLQQAPKGDALRAVQGRLRNAANLKEVMQELRSSFGRPEVIVKTLLNQIRRQVPAKADKLETLIQFAVSVDEMCAAVRTSGKQERYDGPVLDELVSRLPPMIKLMWGIHSLNLQNVNLTAFGKWMQSIKQAAQSVTPPASCLEPSNSKYVNAHSTNYSSQNCTETKCACDDGCAELQDCVAYWQMNIADRWDFVKRRYLCKYCLRKHRAPCKESRQCGKDGCTMKHHPSLHNKAGKIRQEANFSHSTATEESVLLRYVPVELQAGGKTVKTVAFLDDGASVSLIEQSLVDELGLEGSDRPLCLKWTGGQHRTERDSKQVSVSIMGMSSGAKKFQASNVRSVKHLGLPPQRVKMDRLRTKFCHLASIPLPQYPAAAPRILLGMNNYHLTVPLKTIEGQADEPVATKTRLGWVVSGWNGNGINSSIVSFHRAQECDCELIEAKIGTALKGGFALEEPRHRGAISMLSKENERAIAILQKTTVLKGERRLECLERRLSKDPKLRDMMDQVLKEHIEKGYIKKLAESEIQTKHPRKWYLPILPVFNPNKPNKVRVVWDAAAAVNGISLNSMLMTGPDLLSPLPAVLSRFREYAVLIQEEDHNSQRFFWRTVPSQTDPDEYVMLRMTFGSACSPSCAQFVKNMNADRYAERFPEAAECIKSHHYVDDMLTSVESVDEAVSLGRNVAYIHQQGGFQLHNWISNQEEVLRAVGGSMQQAKDLNLDPAMKTQKVLGMWWDLHVALLMG
ncbi:uncharacterized protein LOC118516437 [Anopheles stephensi]|uniref:uncharacterized protein LOC118516437 n=1 Tax=Anopheles stephensi TaxID=30069 RepID=UPI0016589EEF|nr:uncharacterized protein LOC118516437 [Anopheles stephensi]